MLGKIMKFFRSKEKEIDPLNLGALDPLDAIKMNECLLTIAIERLLDSDENAIHKLEEKNVLVNPCLTAHKWEAASILLQSGYSLESPSYLNSNNWAKVYPLLKMDNVLFSQMLRSFTSLSLNFRNKEGDTILHGFDIFDHHMTLGKNLYLADNLLLRATELMEAGVDSTIKNNNNELPFKYIIRHAGNVRNRDVFDKFMSTVEKQRH